MQSVADELCISQSAVSQKLSRLREIFNDQLLVRSKNSMVLTSFGDELLPKLEGVITHIENIYNIIDIYSDDIRPSKNIYTICINSDVYVAELIELLNKIKQDLNISDDVSFKIMSRNANLMQDLLSGKIDFFIGHLSDTPNSIKSLDMRQHTFSFAVRKGHPLAGVHTTGEALGQFKYIELIERPAALSIAYNDKFGKIPGLSSSTFCTQSIRAIVDILETSDSFAYLSDTIITKFNLLSVEITNSDISLQSKLYWHELMDNDTFHRYIREALIDKFKES
ncbi:LysR family transcriptional regulator [Edwardsiella anguillarum]|uniref:LysR family transcriptional regulator n=1 Tax=Edwardsiella anguillarum TaxID=1821960 RepID=A0ABY8SD61_9GAMM|nr:LysR family transcriptional regulator [Edwardsiella anguillarum]WHP79152.1 LysR family transcriptional regulator [Edwardsiella anguillarum]WHP82653.1 LysR family transcriptional regulator [Edwardsiella anguillarum]WHP86451.1 LysR family transcriptional regulator [Edwardsiella anguillarum]WHP90249.1 LysR family transcriptional regulator [Edwardsiella anguillarum]